MPEGRYAVMHFKGPYSGLASAYKTPLRHLAACVRRKKPGITPPIEIYLNSPADAAPDELLTEVCIPLK